MPVVWLPAPEEKSIGFSAAQIRTLADSLTVKESIREEDFAPTVYTRSREVVGSRGCLSVRLKSSLVSSSLKRATIAGRQLLELENKNFYPSTEFLIRVGITLYGGRVDCCVVRRVQPQNALFCIVLRRSPYNSRTRRDHNKQDTQGLACFTCSSTRKQQGREEKKGEQTINLG